MSLDSLLSQAAEVLRRSTIALVILGNSTVAPLATLRPLMEDPRGPGWAAAVERWMSEVELTQFVIFFVGFFFFCFFFSFLLDWLLERVWVCFYSP
jgi:hypothetical protein